MILLLLGCLAAAPLIAQCASSCSDAAPLQFVTVINAGGCPLTLYFPTDSSIRAAYLAPAFCITPSIASALESATLQFEPIIVRGFLGIPVTISDPRLLEEAQATLSPVLQGRILEFLQPHSAQQTRTADFQILSIFISQPRQDTALLNFQCDTEDCTDFLSNIENLFIALGKIELDVNIFLPNSSEISLKSKIVVASPKRDLRPLISPSVRPAPSCGNLKHHVRIAVDGNCTVNVLKRTDKIGHFVIEPMLCFYGNRSYQYIERPQLTRQKSILEVRSDRIRDLVQKNLSSLNPQSVTFLSVIQINAEIPNSTVQSQAHFESLRLTEDGNQVELAILCNSPCQPNEFSIVWIYLKFMVESRLEIGTACTWRSYKYHTPSISDASSFSLSEFGEISDALVCVRPEFTVQYPMLRKAGFCATVCRNNYECQAFSMASGSCQLFVFTSYKRNVTDCGCDKRGRVFVKKLLPEPGHLCPSGYGDTRCSMKYKVFKLHRSFMFANKICQHERGLVILSDLVDTDEMTHAVRLMNRENVTSMWLGGYRGQTTRPDPTDPKPEWKWLGSSEPVNQSLWAPGQPDNFGNISSATEIGWFSRTMMSDVPSEDDVPGWNGCQPLIAGFLCKCLSPFL